MRKRIIACLAALTLVSGCAAIDRAINAPPVASQTALDEQGLLALELAYKAARLSVEVAVDSGMISSPEQKKLWRERNAAAYAALQKARTGYNLANAIDARKAIDSLLGLVEGR